jgi:serine/threonine protein kinase/Tol biopolymer transport system component
MSPQAIAHYRITSKLGEGGMGEVWRATDTKLGRDVAIKVLPEAFARDPDRMARFTREAQMLASLNHPNIAAIYGVEERALVMELVEGPTLAERIATGPIPLDDALPIAKQIAEALEYAHERSIIHRDLKPANIKITPEARVKVLDFGLAKALSNEAAAGDPSSLPTLTMRGTVAGVIMGTAAYMSPEQARGIAADKRADIWSFGVVLYEMLTGRHLFRGETVSDTLAAVLKTDPDWKALPAETPQSIRRLLRRCLERDRKCRTRDIGDALLEIGEARAEPDAPAVTASPKPVSRFLPWIAAALLALPAIWLMRPKPEERLLQLEVSAPPGHTFGTTNISFYAVSPDGGNLAFIARSADGKGSLWVRPLDATQAIRLPGTEGAIAPFWDPTSRWIGFGASEKLQKIEVRGGQPQVLCDAGPSFFSGTWSRDGVILFSDASRTIRRVSAAGGVPSQVLSLDESRKETRQLLPQFLPDGRRFLYFSFAQQFGVAVGSLEGKSRFLMINPNSLGHYAPSRDGKTYLLFIRGNQLMAQPFDAGKAAVSGEPVFIAEPLQSGGPTFSASENGVLIFRRSWGGQAQLTWFDREGKPLGTAGDAGMIFSFRISPDQKSVAFNQADGMTDDIWLFDGERGSTTRFTFGPGIASWPVWSPEGSRIAYSARRSDENLVIDRPASGFGKETVLYRATGRSYFPQSWSRDGRWLLLTGGSSGSFYLLPMGPEGSGGERQPIPFPESPAGGLQPSISPDGRWLLYSSTQTRSQEVFVESMPEAMGGPAASAKKQVSVAGGTQPAWRADGKEIFYLAADGKLMSVPVESGGVSFKLGVPKPLFQTRLVFDSFYRRYDVSADGNRFLLAQPLEESTSVPITVIVNWPALLKKGTGAP